MMFSSEETKMVSMDLPEEIVEEISKRLPVKSLVRFKSVAKSWYAQINDPNFITAFRTPLHIVYTYTYIPNYMGKQGSCL